MLYVPKIILSWNKSIVRTVQLTAVYSFLLGLLLHWQKLNSNSLEFGQNSPNSKCPMSKFLLWRVRNHLCVAACARRAALSMVLNIDFASSPIASLFAAQTKSSTASTRRTAAFPGPPPFLTTHPHRPGKTPGEPLTNTENQQQRSLANALSFKGT